MRRSPRTYLLVAIVAAAALGLGRTFQRTPAKSGRVALLSPSRAATDFGEAWEDQRFAWKLPLTNTTPETVRVLDISASCMCVSIEPQAFTLPPGATRELTLVFDLTAKPNEKAGTTRTFAAELSIVTATQTVAPAPERVTVKGTVRPVLDVQPRDPSFGTRSDRVQPPLPTTFTVTPAAAIESLTAVCDSPGFTANVRPVPNGALAVTVTPTLPVSAGPFAADVRLIPKGTTGDLPERRVKVLGLIAPDIAADPPEVSIGGRAVGETREETVSVASLTGRAAAVEKATAHGDGVTAELTPNGAVRVRVAVARAGELRGRVELQVRSGTDAPTTVTVPVIGYGTAAGLHQGGQP
jgi:Protein of unknown function (DUF1573)